jgi:hypothetical protein
MINCIYRDNPELKEFTPHFSLRKLSIGYPKIHIEEVYEPTEHLKSFLCAIKGHQMQQHYVWKDLRELVSLYMVKNEIGLRKGWIMVDPLLE